MPMKAPSPCAATRAWATDAAQQTRIYPAGNGQATEIIADALAGERLDDAEHASRINLTLGRAEF